MQSPLVIAFSLTGDGLDGGRLHRFALARFRVTIFVSYTCRCSGEVAERPKAAVC